MSNIFDVWQDMVYTGFGFSDWFKPCDDLNDGGKSAYEKFKGVCGPTPADLLRENRPSDGTMIKRQLIHAHGLAMYRAFLLRNLTASRAFIIADNRTHQPIQFMQAIADNFEVPGKERTI